MAEVVTDIFYSGLTNDLLVCVHFCPAQTMPDAVGLRCTRAKAAV
jgi:hypothetical protein